jgi:hypothetical protein
VLGIPECLYYDKNYPTATIKLYPYDSGVSTLTLYTTKPLVSFVSLDTVYAFPPEYERALVYNLAIEWSPDFQVEPSPTVMRIANEAKDAVYTANTRNDNNTMSIDSFLAQQDTYNIYRGS